MFKQAEPALLCHLGVVGFTGGFVGVDVFFVISGYLITKLLRQELLTSGKLNIINFYFRRTKRIVPALAATLILSFIASVWLLNIVKFKTFGGAVATAALSVSNIFFSTQAGYFDEYSKYNPLLNTWSLGVEEQFYIFWPLLLLLFVRLFGVHLGIFRLVYIVIISSFLLNIISFASSDDLYYLVQYRAFELAAGAALSMLPNIRTTNTAIWFAELTTLLGYGLIGFSVYYYTAVTLFPSYPALLPVFGSMLLIRYGDAKYFGVFLRTKLAVGIGLISYSLYLVHWPVITLWKTYNENIGDLFMLTAWQSLGAITLSCVLAVLMFRYIETPARRLELPQGGAQLVFVIKSISIMASLAVLGFFVFRSDGWLWRANAHQGFIDTKSIANFHQENWGGASFKGGLIHEAGIDAGRLVILGDSHAGMLYSGLMSELGIPDSISIFTISGGGAGKYYSSLLLPGTTRLAKQQSLPDISSRQALSELIQEFALDKRSVLIYSVSYVGQLPEAADLDTHTAWDNHEKEAFTSIKFDKLLNAFDRLNAIAEGRNIIIIGDVPGTKSYHPAQCMVQLRWFSSDACKNIQSAQLSSDQLEINKLLKSYVDNHGNMIFIDPFDILCHNGACLNITPEGYPIYSDGSHFSKYGSRYFISQIKGRILSTLKKQ